VAISAFHTGVGFRETVAVVRFPTDFAEQIVHRLVEIVAVPDAVARGELRPLRSASEP